MQTVLIVGASGATGRLLVAQLLERGHQVRAIVRSPDRLPAELREHPQLTVIQAAVLDLSDAELAAAVDGCSAVASCLGHNLTFTGMYGQPRRLVTDALCRLCAAITAGAPATPVRVVLMNTTGVRNPDLAEQISTPQAIVIGLLRALLPPHADNEEAAAYLRTTIGPEHASIEWTAVRPDGLIDAADVSPYDLHPSPIRSAIFDSGKTSRINVAHFMAELICDDATWTAWRSQTPVIYNRDPS